MFAAKRYDIIRQYIGNPVREYTKLVDMYKLNTTLYKNPVIGNAHFIASNENRFVEKSIQLIQFALAVNDKKSAIEIQQKAMKIVEDYRLRDAVAKK